MKTSCWFSIQPSDCVSHNQKPDYRIVLSKDYPTICSEYPPKIVHLNCELEPIYSSRYNLFCLKVRENLIDLLSTNNYKVVVKFTYKSFGSITLPKDFLTKVFDNLLYDLNMSIDLFNAKFVPLNLSWSTRVKIQKTILRKE